MSTLKYLIIFSVLLISPLRIYADGNESLFASANARYAEGEYAEAIESYEQILLTGQHSPSLYYNLGNAYFKNNELTRAILNFERALLYAPADEDIMYNLDIANILITDRIDAVPDFFLKTWIIQLQNLFSANLWGLISLIGFALASMFLTLFILIRKQGFRRLSLPGVILALLLSVGALSFANQQKNKVNNRNTCIVFAPTVTIKSSPDESGTNLFVLHEGVKLSIIDRLSQWYEIKLADGNIGWISSEAVEII